MKHLPIIASLVGLGLTVVPACLVFAGALSWHLHAVLMAVGTVVWFAAAPFWMRSKRA